MERNQDVDVLSKTCFPLLENSKFGVSVEKCASAKISDSILHQGNSGNTSNFTDSSFLTNRNQSHLDHPFNSSVVSVNSSPHHFESNMYQQFDEKKAAVTKISEPVPGNDVMRHAGMGRGKQRAKFPLVNDVETTKLSLPPQTCNLDADSDKPLNCNENLEVENETSGLSSEASKVKSPSENIEFSSQLDTSAVNDSHEQHLHMKLNDNPVKNAETKNVPNSTLDRFRDHDVRRLQNGIDSGGKGNYNKGKPYRLSRYHNSGAPPVQYKSYDSRPMPQHFSLPPNLKQLRTVKGNETYYRHDNNRRNQSSKPPFPADVDKAVYSKTRMTMCAEKDPSVYDSNRNLNHNYSANKSDVNHMTVTDSYVPRTGLSAFRRRSFGNKTDHVNNSKQWSSNRLYSDSNTSTVSCHSRTVVTPAKSLEPRHCGTCNLTDKNGNNNNNVLLKTESCSANALEHTECLSLCDKELTRPKEGCGSSPENMTHYSVIHGSSNQCVDGNSTNEPLPLSTQLPAMVAQFPSPVDPSGGDPDLSNHPSSYESGLTEKAVLFSSGLSNCDLQCESIYSSHQKGQESIVLSKPPLVNSTDAVQAPVTYNGLNHCAPTTMTVTQASYADIIRTPTVGLNKVSVSHVFHPSSSVSKASEITSTSAHDVLLQKDTEQPNSSEWIISRLSQQNASASNAHSINGVVHHQTSCSQDGVHPRPIAVSLEKPSFYNSSFGVGKTLNSLMQQSNLSSPEKRMLECQMVEEQLCGVLASKKTDEKLSFLSELPANLPSPSKHTTNIACANARTDSVFSDSSSVCSSTSSTFKTDVQHRIADMRGSVPPVIIMNNCMPSGNVSDISFGIEMDEIIQICSDKKDSSDACAFSDSNLDLSFKKSVNKPMSEKEASGVTSCTVENMRSCLNFLTVGGKKLLWEGEDVDVSKCNLGHIVDFLQESWHHVEIAAKDGSGESSDAVKYYSNE